jgi:hypothetical protein
MSQQFQYVKPEQISLKSHATLTEKWVQDRIAEDPSILSLGDLVLKDKERTQPRAGRLDLLLQDSESNRRYEVEIQLGPTDESHIIRTIEYWDIERKRYPQYEHCAVIVAEEITARFLNVITLFNGTIPLVAIQMKAIRVGDQVALLFTKVLDELTRGLVDDDEEVKEITDRAYWEARGSKATVAIADALLDVIREFAPSMELRYNKFYIGMADGGEPNNFAILRAKKAYLRLELRLAQSEPIREDLERSGLELMDYESQYGRYRIRLTPPEVIKHRELLAKLLKLSYEQSKS